MENRNISKKCGICGTTFYKKQNKSWKEWNSVAKYCSRRCSALSVRDVTIARNIAGTGRKLSDSVKTKMSLSRKGQVSHMKGKKHRLETKIKIRQSTLAAQTTEVRLKKSLAHRGSKSHNWKGGRVSLKHRMRTTSSYINWRTAVFTRDDFACTWCGDSRGGNLEADHIITVESIFNAFKIKTIEDVLDNSLLWESCNGRTLCKPCHITRHNLMV